MANNSGTPDATVAVGDASGGDDGGDAADVSAASDDGSSVLDDGSSADGDNACKTKLCVDPIFDCPLQGCFNGCTNFFCN
jgi:hypothetical protein